jgi:hypothetical protein
MVLIVVVVILVVIGMLLDSRSGLLKGNAFEVFQCSVVLFLLYVKFQVLSGKDNNVVVFPILFHIFMPLANLWFIPFQG